VPMVLEPTVVNFFGFIVFDGSIWRHPEKFRTLEYWRWPRSSRTQFARRFRTCRFTLV
jgi:hypothetical protein